VAITIASIPAGFIVLGIVLVVWAIVLSMLAIRVGWSLWKFLLRGSGKAWPNEAQQQEQGP
jgi:hypothetical protein